MDITTYVNFDDYIGSPLDEHAKAEIEDVLKRIEVGDKIYKIKVNKDKIYPWQSKWRSKPKEIKVIRKLSGGRGSSEVFEVRVIWGDQNFLKVIKIGPSHDLKDELKGFESINDRNSFFAPIDAATPGILDLSRMEPGIREALVYAHAQEWMGRRGLQTFEEIAHKAVTNGGLDLEKATCLLETLFKGINENLYYQDRRIDSDTSLNKFWNHRLGPNGIIEIEEFSSRKKLLHLGSPSNYLLKEALIFPREITAKVTWKDGEAKPGDFVYLIELIAQKRGNRLIGISKADSFLQFEIKAIENKNIQDIAEKLNEGSLFRVYGRLKSIREKTHKDHLLSKLKELKAEDGLIKGPGATVPDPFVLLPELLRTRQSRIITSLVHGDLNPRNILVVEDLNPCLIDYANTGSGQTLLSDFVRLEGCLARDILPEDLNWKQHVRLQRLLAASCRLGDETVERFTQLLAQERQELASAFRLLYTIRKASKNAYSESERHQWYQDYLEQLFLFAHLTLKWEKDQTPQALRATTAMAGVASEAVSKEEIYRWRSLEDLQCDDLENIRLLKEKINRYKLEPEVGLYEMANFARGIDLWKKRKRDSLLFKYEHIKDEYLRESAINQDLDHELGDTLISEFEELRVLFVRNTFCNEVKITRKELKEHEVFISLQAYIDLKGRISPAKGQELHFFKEVLQSDSLLAEKEGLSLGERGDDAIHLLADQQEAVLIGDAGAGKSTVAREWEFRLVGLIKGEEEDTIDRDLNRKKCTRFPIIIQAPDLSDKLKNWDKDNKQSTADAIKDSISSKVSKNFLKVSEGLLTVGALHITIDSLNELTEEKRRTVVDWIITLRKMYPRTPVLVCHRQYNYTPGLLPFPVITLEKVSEDQARKYVLDYLREKKVPDHDKIAKGLIKFLLEDPDQEHVRDLAQTPFFLWMIVNFYQEKKEIPKSRGQLFEKFSQWYIEERHHINERR
jgi:hypothetical protein